MSWMSHLGDPNDWEGFVNAYNNLPTGYLNELNEFRGEEWKGE